MPDRPVSLDLRTLSGDAGSLPGEQGGSRRRQSSPDADLVQRFAAALAHPGDRAALDEPVPSSPFSLFTSITLPERDRPVPSDRAPNEMQMAHGSVVDRAVDTPSEPAQTSERLSTGDQASTSVLTLPIAPAGLAVLHPSLAPEQNPPPAQRHLLQTVAELASRLMVSDGRQGRREARIELSDEAFAGVTVSIYQVSGEWVAEFHCAEPKAFETLSEPSERMAQELANALGAPACWLVMTDPPDGDPVESRALPERTTSR